MYLFPTGVEVKQKKKNKTNLTKLIQLRKTINDINSDLIACYKDMNLRPALGCGSIYAQVSCHLRQ